MALSIFTNSASMSAMNALNHANGLLSTAMEHLGTGKRINSAKDDAAGLQIATRLQSQSNGMAVAQRNIADATAMLQTGEGAFNEVTNIMYRMKDLATQAANDTNTEKDRSAISDELKQLQGQLGTIMNDTTYGGDKLFTASGKFDKDMQFQIGSNSTESMKVNFHTQLSGIKAALTNISGQIDIKDASGAQKLMDTLQSGLESVGSLRSSLGANINRLSHASANLANMKDNTDVAMGNIQDADMATEASTMTRNQMLSQTGMMMVKQSNSMSSMVMSLLN